MTKTTNTTYLMAPNTIYLYDYNTGECCGPATDEQITASEATDTGAILIDTRTGEVMTAGSWDATDAAYAGATRIVFTI
jgi:hypothetical protein